MKFTRLSLAALAVAGFASSAMAMDLSSVTAKPFAGAKLYYEATDLNGNDMFDKKSASGQALVNLGVTGKFDSCWGYGFEYMIADTLGLENNLVGNVRMGAGEDLGMVNVDNQQLVHVAATKGALQTHDWASQAYITYSPCDTILSNTTFKIGRQYIDTPLAFTERWNLAPNSFDAIVVLNQDIKNVTLVGAYVGRGNGQFITVSNADVFEGYPGNALGSHQTYAVGALTKLIPGLPINAWYYNIDNIADAYWLDGGYTYNLDDSMSIGIAAQYGSIMPDASALGDTNGYGVKLSTKVGIFSLMAAYSNVDDDNGKAKVALANTATTTAYPDGNIGGKKTKLYTANIYTDGTAVAIPGSEAWKVGVSTDIDGIGKFIVNYNSCENDDNNPMHNVDEVDVILATKLAGINTKLIYMNRDVTKGAVKDTGLKDDTNHLRVILSKNF